MYRSRERCCLLQGLEERVLLKAQRSCGQASPTNLGNKKNGRQRKAGTIRWSKQRTT